ncbi:MAG: hypothetical protein ACI4BB_05825 [Coprococcus sp.]
MDFITNMMGLALFLVCICIVLIFLKDYLRLTGKKVKTETGKKRSFEGITYEIYYKGRQIDKGIIEMDELPVQFGRESGFGNDIIVVPDGVPEDDKVAVSRAWFFVQTDAREQLMIYAAEPSAGGEKKLSTKLKLLVDEENTGKGRPMRSVRLDGRITLKADQFRVILGVQK